MNRRYEKNSFECLIVYVRRRVGKTALINEFCKGKPTVFFSALNASDKENPEALSKAIYEKDHPGSDSAPGYQSFDAAFDEITRMTEKERFVFVIDEYPYLAKANKSISSRLQHIIDHTWKNGQLYLILCGSSMSFMEYQVLGYESPLYGRRTGQYKIKALTYREITAFNPALTNEQQSLVYGITGGIPHTEKIANIEEAAFNDQSTVVRIRPLQDGRILMVIDNMLVELTETDEEYHADMQSLTLGYLSQKSGGIYSESRPALSR